MVATITSGLSSAEATMWTPIRPEKTPGVPVGLRWTCPRAKVPVIETIPSPDTVIG